jgi:hypothetical protein
MSLRNLLKIGQLEEHETSAEQVRRMLDSAERAIIPGAGSVATLDKGLEAITQKKRPRPGANHLGQGQWEISWLRLFAATFIQSAVRSV